MRVYLVRHGQSAANLTNSFAGWLDVPLTDSGKQDGSNAGNFLRQVDFEKVYTGDLTRAIQTAEYALPSAEKHLDARLREIDVGQLGGCTISDCTEKYGNEFLANRQSADFTPYGGENFTMLMHRIGEFLTEVSKAHVGNVAVFTHGCTIGAVLSYVLHMTTLAPIALPGNGSICIIEFTEGQWRVVSWNIPPL